MLNRKSKFFKKKDSGVFEIKRPNTKSKKTLFLLELVLVAVVVAGTLYGLGKYFNFSPYAYFNSGIEKVKPISPVLNSSSKATGKADFVVEAIPEEVIKIKKVQEETNEYVRVLSTQGVSVLFSLNKDIDEQITTLQNLLTKAKINKKKVKKVDLRFDKVVVVYQN